MMRSLKGLMAETKFLHVVAFNIPYPPNYGGIIDIFYKLTALHQEGVKIILHAFLYDRKEAESLSEIASEVHYYRRKRGVAWFFNRKPYIVVTRQSKDLERRLLNDTHPVLFEGLHSTFLLEKCKNAGKKVLVRTHNIEHNYYSMLARSERGLYKKLFFLAEARKLKKYEKILEQADNVLAISTTDHAYFKEKYGNSIYVSAFQLHEAVTARSGKGEYILFHGNLSVPENEKALLYLVKNVLSKVTYRVIIAGKDPGRIVRKSCSRYSNIELISNPDNAEMNRLVEGAQINLLYTHQPTGLKLKLLHSLYGGRHCMANPLMLSGSNLDNLCILYTSPAQAIEKIEEFIHKPFEASAIALRIATLKEYNNAFNVKKITNLI